MKRVVEMRKDIAFFTKMFPLVQIHPQAYGKSKSILCSESNSRALELLEDALKGRKIPNPSCETDIVDRSLRLGNSLAVEATPTMIFPDGKKVSGAKKADDIIRMIDLLDLE
jgi:thiol:disulfide interchange protein DsbC